MRIMIVNTLYPPLVIGGAEKSVSLLAEALVRAGDKVSVITLHPGLHTAVAERNGVRIYRLPLHNLYWPFERGVRRSGALRILWHILDMWNPRAAREVGRILDIERPDVVHTNNISGFSVAVFAQAKSRGIRLVHTLRDYYMLCARYTLFRGGKVCEGRCADCRLLTANRRLLSRSVDAVVSNSEYVLDRHREFGWFRGVPGTVIFNIAEESGPDRRGTGRPQSLPSGAGQSGLEATLAEATAADADDTLIFGFIGKVEAEKGIDVLLAATKVLHQSNWRLRIAGKGLDAFVTSLKAQYPDGRIEWLGFAGPALFYSSIDVCVIASVWAEPLPRTLIETFAAGKSAICARSGGILEISSLGNVVATYKATDARELAARMDAAMGDVDRWRRGGWRDREAAEVFSEAAITRRYREVYRSEDIDLKESRKHPVHNLHVKEMV